MKTLFRSKIIFLLCLFFISCSANRYISQEAELSSFEGAWHFDKSANRILTIKEIEKNIYNLKFKSESNVWEGIGYQIGNELLSIFKYQNLNSKGYVTFKFIDKNNIYYESMSTNGDFRSKGNYYKQKSP